MGVFSRDFFGASGNLNKIRGWLQNPNASEESRIWNYGRYAYVQLSTNGTNNAGLCPGTSGVILGDRDYSGDNSGYTSAVQRSGERDIPQYPILESVRINNDGATDVSDAALFDIDVTFKCYSISQFETYEAAYFKVGTGVDLSFGYKDLDGLGGSMTANVYNFGFTLDATGVYSCNMKLTGKNRFAAVLTVAQTLVGEGTTVTDDEGNELQSDTIIQELNNRFIESFPDFEESTSIQFSATVDFVPDGEAVQSSDGLYAVSNIQTKGGFDFTALGLRIDTDDMFIKYVSFEELVNVIKKSYRNVELLKVRKDEYKPIIYRGGLSPIIAVKETKKDNSYLNVLNIFNFVEANNEYSNKESTIMKLENMFENFNLSAEILLVYLLIGNKKVAKNI